MKAKQHLRKPRTRQRLRAYGIAASVGVLAISMYGATATIAATRSNDVILGRHFHHFHSSTTTTTAPETTTSIDPDTTTSTDPSTTTSTDPSTTTSIDPSTTTSIDPDTTTSTDPSTTTSTEPPTTSTTAPSTTTTTTPPPSTPYPVGVVDANEPSGLAPPASNALPGYSETYNTDFPGAALPSGWSLFSGAASGDPGSQWANSHVTVSDGLLQLNTYQDPAYNNAWIDGGVCHCEQGRTYGAYFVRSRTTGPGPTVVQLLWPTDGSWPPEIDFDETYGLTTATSATVHYTAANSQVQSTLSIDMSQWHTFGVIWTPTSITYTVDGQVWGADTNLASIPNVPMTLDIDQQTWCSSGFACPTAPVSQLVDWVAEYTAN